jgi:glycopeptide antibiotics resistance protein
MGINIIELFLIAMVVTFPIFLLSRGRKVKAQRYNSLSTNEKILYNIEQLNEKAPSPLEELFWSIIGMVVGLVLPFGILFNLFN